MSGLLIGGRLVEVPGVEVISPGQQPWAILSPRDYMIRKASWVRQIILHTTKGKWPQRVIPGKGRGGRDKVVADFWRGTPEKPDLEHSAAQLVVDNDGSIVCLCDLKRIAAYHATTANDFSVGIEIYQELDGGIYEAALVSTVKLVQVLCDEFNIPFQGSRRQYNNLPLKRMIAGEPGHRGEDCVGVFGHRDVAWDFTHRVSTRGQGDPGDEIFNRLFGAGMIGFNYDMRADIAYWVAMQGMMLVQGRYAGKLDGVCGPATVAAMRQLGLWVPAVNRVTRLV